MITLSKGYFKPQNPDTGDVWFPAEEANIQRLNDHNHDGANSQFLSTVSQSILSAGWTAAPQGGGLFRQTLTVPSGMTYDTCDVWVLRSTGERAYATMERISSTTFFLYTNDSSLNYTVQYR